MSARGQLALPLDMPRRAARGRDDFFVSDANRLALAQVDGWRDWPGGRLALAGPEGAGKSHLARVWAEQSGARVIEAEALAGADPVGLAEAGPLAVEDADRGLSPEGERALFHLMNAMSAAGAPLLLTGRAPPARWSVATPDLASRLQSVPVARLDPPDDLLAEALIVRLVHDRQMPVEAELPRYLALRLPRAFAAYRDAVQKLDRAALAQRAYVSRVFAGRVLDIADTPPARRREDG